MYDATSLWTLTNDERTHSSRAHWAASTTSSAWVGRQRRRWRQDGARRHGECVSRKRAHCVHSGVNMWLWDPRDATEMHMHWSLPSPDQSHRSSEPMLWHRYSHSRGWLEKKRNVIVKRLNGGKKIVGFTTAQLWGDDITDITVLTR